MKFKVQRQLTAALENVPGRLAAICDIISQNGIYIEGICVVDNVEQGVIRLITDNAAEARRLLVEQHIYVVEADVVAVEVTDQLGTLARIGAILAAENINIDYMYGSCLEVGTRTRIIFKVSDLTKTQQILSQLELP